ncbi:MAG TPA: hypothetical protein VGM05_28005 [Planctomycetaceae bacterium]|jgi:hypothetical protein
MAWNWLKHAFAIEPEAAIAATAGQRAIIDRLSGQIVSRGLTTPTLVFLESVRPLNYVSSQILQFFSPILSAVADREAVNELAAFLEHRGSVEFLCKRIEELEIEERKSS